MRVTAANIIQPAAINNSPVRCVYRVRRDIGQGIVRLFVTRDAKIWIGYGAYPAVYLHCANVGDRQTSGTGRDAVCRAANCW